MPRRISSAGQSGLQRSAAMVAFVMLVTPGAIFAADFESGLTAFRDGNVQRALEEWQPLARGGDPDAQHALGKMYEYGHGVQRDDTVAADWYLRAAKQNVSDAQYRLGVLHDNGWGVVRDASVAARWYGRAARLGHTFAQHDLAFMYLNGTGVPKDRIQAYMWLKIAAEQRADLMEKHLRHVSKDMTADEIIRAEDMARDWLDSQQI